MVLFRTIFPAGGSMVVLRWRQCLQEPGVILAVPLVVCALQSQSVNKDPASTHPSNTGMLPQGHLQPAWIYPFPPSDLSEPC